MSLPDDQIRLENKVSLGRDVLTQQFDGETVLLDLKTDEYYALDAVGARMMLCLLRASSIQAAATALLTEYDVEPERLEADLLALAHKLLDHGLVTIN
jgi:hypothetical protein